MRLDGVGMREHHDGRRRREAQREGLAEAAARTRPGRAAATAPSASPGAAAAPSGPGGRPSAVGGVGGAGRLRRQRLHQRALDDQLTRAPAGATGRSAAACTRAIRPKWLGTRVIGVSAMSAHRVRLLVAVAEHHQHQAGQRRRLVVAHLEAGAARGRDRAGHVAARARASPARRRRRRSRAAAPWRARSRAGRSRCPAARAGFPGAGRPGRSPARRSCGRRDGRCGAPPRPGRGRRRAARSTSVTLMPSRYSSTRSFAGGVARGGRAARAPSGRSASAARDALRRVGLAGEVELERRRTRRSRR